MVVTIKGRSVAEAEGSLRFSQEESSARPRFRLRCFRFRSDVGTGGWAFVEGRRLETLASSSITITSSPRHTRRSLSLRPLLPSASPPCPVDDDAAHLLEAQVAAAPFAPSSLGKGTPLGSQ